MKIFVAGGTGAIGRPLIEELRAKGHVLVALTRSPEKAQESAGGILAACITKFKRFFKANGLKAVSNKQGEMKWQQATRKNA